LHAHLPTVNPRAGEIASIGISLYVLPIDRVQMSIVKVSPKFQVVIPREIREALRLQPGQKVQVLQ